MRRAAASIRPSASSAVELLDGPAPGVAHRDSASDHPRDVDQPGARARQTEHLSGGAGGRRARRERRSLPRRQDDVELCKARGRPRLRRRRVPRRNARSARAISGDQSALARATRCQSSGTATRVKGTRWTGPPSRRPGLCRAAQFGCSPPSVLLYRAAAAWDAATRLKGSQSNGGNP